MKRAIAASLAYPPLQGMVRKLLTMRASVQSWRIASSPGLRAMQLERSRRDREHRLGVGKACWEDDLDVAVLNLGVDGRRTGVLAADELRRAVGHDVAGKARGSERRDDRLAVGG